MIAHHDRVAVRFSSRQSLAIAKTPSTIGGQQSSADGLPRISFPPQSRLTSSSVLDILFQHEILLFLARRQHIPYSTTHMPPPDIQREK
jgi:hypothetical protein